MADGNQMVENEVNDEELEDNMLVRSISSTQRAYLRFTNKTSRLVDVWWRNFHGARVHYVRLKPHTYFDVNSYITHPWEFTDVSTSERYVIENKRIFRPPKDIADKGLRTNWNITIGVRSLRKTALLTIASYIKNPESVKDLQLPNVLIADLHRTITEFYRPPTRICEIDIEGREKPNKVMCGPKQWFSVL